MNKAVPKLGWGKKTGKSIGVVLHENHYAPNRFDKFHLLFLSTLWSTCALFLRVMLHCKTLHLLFVSHFRKISKTTSSWTTCIRNVRPILFISEGKLKRKLSRRRKLSDMVTLLYIIIENSYTLVSFNCRVSFFSSSHTCLSYGFLASCSHVEINSLCTTNV